jgi:hypothetical protein
MAWSRGISSFIDKRNELLYSPLLLHLISHYHLSVSSMVVSLSCLSVTPTALRRCAPSSLVWPPSISILSLEAVNKV